MAMVILLVHSFRRCRLASPDGGWRIRGKIPRYGKPSAVLLLLNPTRFMNRPTRYLLSSLPPPPAARTSRPRLRFVSSSRPTTRFSLSTIAPSKNRRSAIAITQPSTAAAAAIMDPRAPEPDPNSGEYFVHIKDPDPNVESLGKSFVGVDVAREVEDNGEEADCQSGGGDACGSVPAYR